MQTWQVDSSQCKPNKELYFDFDEASNSIDVGCQVEDFPTVYHDELSGDESNFKFSDNDIDVSICCAVHATALMYYITFQIQL